MSVVLIAGLLPCVVLLVYIYGKDKVEKEPPGLLLKLLIFGAISTIPAIFLEVIGLTVLQQIGMSPDSTAFLLVENFIVIAVAEEGSKKFMLRLGSWKNPEFNYIFDGVVYGVCVSLGFAGLENVGYISGFGVEVAILRGIAAVPLHAICGVFMGHFYGLQKAYDKYGNAPMAKRCALLSMVIPVFIHGFYDFCASSQNTTLTYAWLIFVIVMDIIAFRSISKYSKEDQGF